MKKKWNRKSKRKEERGCRKNKEGKKICEKTKKKKRNVFFLTLRKRKGIQEANIPSKEETETKI